MVRADVSLVFPEIGQAVLMTTTQNEVMAIKLDSNYNLLLQLHW